MVDLFGKLAQPPTRTRKSQRLKPPSDVAFVRLWLGEGAPLAGFIAVAVLSIIVIGALIVPIGRPELVVGQIMAFGSNETNTGSYPVADIQLGAMRVDVVIPRANRCAVGGLIRLQWIRYVWGRSLQPGWPPCS